MRHRMIRITGPRLAAALLLMMGILPSMAQTSAGPGNSAILWYDGMSEPFLKPHHVGLRTAGHHTA